MKSSDINAWLKDATGEDVSAKDFRTWGATVLAAVGLAVARCRRPRPRASGRWRASSRRSPTTSATRPRSRARPTSTRATFDRYLDGVTIAGTLPGLAEAGDGTAIQGAVEDAVLELLTGEDSPALAPPGGEEIAAELAKAA